MNELLLKIINEVLVCNEHEILPELDPQLNLRTDLGMDSIVLAELTVKIENLTGIDIFEDTIIYTIGDIMKKLNVA